ncbi:hypothetical protein [Pseudomonas sp.]|nr:hypothetical protein [Pseudomonas sp.]
MEATSIKLSSEASLAMQHPFMQRAPPASYLAARFYSLFCTGAVDLHA